MTNKILMLSSRVVFWFRRDLRLEDNKGLQASLASGLPVMPIFIFDTDILGKLSCVEDRRVDYIYQAINKLHITLKTEHQSGIFVFYGKPLDIFKEILEEYPIEAVYCNTDYEPSAISRDANVKDFLKTKGKRLYEYKDQVIFEKNEVIKSDGTPYTVYSPYARKWLSKLQASDYEMAESMGGEFVECNKELRSISAIGFKKTDIVFSPPVVDETIIKSYAKYRDFPALEKTSHLATALRFGTISIRKCVSIALKFEKTWLSELIWREFFMQILYHFPYVIHRSFKSKYDAIPWRNDPKEFQLWCEGKTGYPIVDAGMLQLNKTGWMHNRVRMIVASFLTKHLLIDWRWGEAYFSNKLLDYDLSANNGNWQWAASCGCDAVPYFRIFNPDAQTIKFDQDFIYVKKWNPDYLSKINQRIVFHEFARARALETFKKALS